MTEEIDSRLTMAVISGGSSMGLLVVALVGLLSMYCVLKRSMDYYHKD